MSIGIGYKVGVKEEVVNALKGVFDSSYPDPQFANRVNVTIANPLRPDHYPALIINITEQTLNDVGIGNYLIYTDPITDINKIIRQWRFTGSIDIEVRALTPLDRDILAQGLIEIFAFGHEVPQYKKFYNEVYDSDFANIQLLTQQIQPNGEGEEAPPWDDMDAKVYTCSYSIPFMGEFFTDPQTGRLIRISQVNAFAYRDGSSVPQGSQAFGTDGEGRTFDDRTVPWGGVPPEFEEPTGGNFVVETTGTTPGLRNVYIGPNAPTNPIIPYIWIQTGLGDGSDYTVWVEDGS